MTDAQKHAEALYARRDHRALGDHYIRHVDHMTSEGLHSKSAIAAELAWRDSQIQKLQESVESLRRAGAPLANIAFNLAQRRNEVLTSAHADALSDARKDWDKAVKEALK